jgi:type II pantothenate kinase
LPFARYLLKKGTKIVLAANTHPSVNDITASELQEIIDKIVSVDKIFADAVASEMIEVIQSGSGSPCLDFLKISDDLCRSSTDVDLIVIERMGRAIHTNFYANFKVDSVKIGVFKNPQIAEYLGAQLYEGMVIYTPA